MTNASSTTKQSAAERIVSLLLEKLDQGISPWHMPWKCMGVPQSVDGRPYRGINALLLALNPYKQPKYLTFNRCKALGGNVKKGERGHYVVFWDRISKKETREDGTEETRSFFIIKGYTVFNVEQCEGLPKKCYVDCTQTEHNPIAEAEAIWEGYADRPELKHINPNEAYYSPSKDYINTPEPSQFESAEAYYSTLFHEASHSTGAEKRLNRLTKTHFGTEAYSEEELVAEISAQILCQSCGITRTLDNAAAYCESWAKHLRGESARNIVGACSAAQKAADYILGGAQNDGEADEAEA